MKHVAKELLRMAKTIVAGGSDFYVFIKGTDAKKAFRDAVDNASHNSGHGGYSGTIAEKNSFEIVSGPLTKKQAQNFASDKMDENDKWGPAFAIPVVGDAGQKTVDVKPIKVFAQDSNAAIDIVLAKFKDKFKGYNVDWDKKSAELLKSGGWSLKKTFSGNGKIVPKYVFKADYNSGPSMSSPKDALESLKRHLDDLQSKGRALPSKVEIIALGSSVPVMGFSVESKRAKGSQFVVSGKLIMSKPSDKIEGYLFFGIASS